MSPDAPRVLYILGTGRSGSTALAMLLGSAPDAVSLGELEHVERDLRVPSKRCSCGQPVAECPTWRDAVASRSGSRAVPQLPHRHLRVWMNGLPGYGGRVSGAVGASFLGLMREVDPRERFVIDSSKFATRALELAAALPGTKVVWLRRRPAGLLASFSKRRTGEQPGRSPFGVLLYYVYVTLCARWVTLRLGDRVYRLDYETLLDHPSETLTKLADWSGLDLAPVIRSVEQGDPLEMGHMITANRMRALPEFRLSARRPDPAPSTFGGRVVLLAMRAWRRLVRA